MDRPHALTTREAASLLGCRPREALALLRAARTPMERLGPLYLWQRRAVERLARTLTGAKPEGGHL